MITFIIIAFSVAAFAIQLSYMSSLSDSVKRTIGLSVPYKFSNLHHISSWKKIIKNNFVFISLFPFTVVFIVLGKLHQLLSGVVNCSYCSSFWIMLMVNIIILGLATPIAIVTASFALVCVTILEKLLR